MSAIFLTYFGVGVLLMLGLEALTSTFGAALNSPAAYGVQGLIGAGLLIYSIAAPKTAPARSAPRAADAKALGGLFVLGVTVTALEFPTAFPYLGAVGILTAANLPISVWLPVLLVYNVIFVLPPLLLLAVHTLLRERLEARFAGWREKLQHGARETMLWLFGIVGFFLLADSLRYFEFFGLVDLNLPDLPDNGSE